MAGEIVPESRATFVGISTKIGQLTVERDLYEDLAVKQATFLCLAEEGFSVPASGNSCVAHRSGQDWPEAPP